MAERLQSRMETGNGTEKLLAPSKGVQQVNGVTRNRLDELNLALGRTQKVGDPIKDLQKAAAALIKSDANGAAQKVSESAPSETETPLASLAESDDNLVPPARKPTQARGIVTPKPKL